MIKAEKRFSYNNPSENSDETGILLQIFAAQVIVVTLSFSEGRDNLGSLLCPFVVNFNLWEISRGVFYA